MRRIREIIECYHLRDLNQVETGLSCGVSRGSVQNYLTRLAESGLEPREALALSDADLDARLFPEPPAKAIKPSDTAYLPDWDYVTKELHRKGVTRKRLWQEHSRDKPDAIGYSQFCRLLEVHQGKSQLVMRHEHKGGDAVYTDYSGDRPSWVDRSTGELHSCELFVMCWGASSLTYVEAHASQRLECWLGAHMRAYAYFGCCPRREVLDNLKSGVTRACRYDPEGNPAYVDMSHHYNIAVIPARPRKPTDKAKVENAVLQAQRSILACIRNEEYHSQDELNVAIRLYMEELNTRPMQGYGGKSRRELFEELDRPQAQQLPQEPWIQRAWHRCRAGVDYCVQIEKRSYSVPYTYVGRELTAIVSERMVEVFCEGERIAIHERITKPFGYSIQPEHRPDKHRNVYAWTPERIRSWAGKTGPSTAEYIQALFASKHLEEEAYRPALGIIRLAEKHPAEVVEKASKIALSRCMFRMAQFQSILTSPLLHREEPEVSNPVKHVNLRGLEGYAEEIKEIAQ
jgi:transposase